MLFEPMLLTSILLHLLGVVTTSFSENSSWFSPAERKGYWLPGTPVRKQPQGLTRVCLLHPLFLEADEALVHHTHRQVLVGQCRFHLIQDGGANWEQGWVVSIGEREAASAFPTPLTAVKGRPAWQHPPRSAATGLPLVTTNSYLLRDWSSSHPAG